MKKMIFCGLFLSLAALADDETFKPALVGPAANAIDLPVWRQLVDKAEALFPDGTHPSKYYELLKSEQKDLKSLRGAVMALVETSDFQDPWQNWSVGDRREVYKGRREDLGSPSESALQLLQQLALENLAAELSSALPLGEKLHFASVRKQEAFYNPYGKFRDKPKLEFSDEEKARLERYCWNAVKLARFVEMLPGGDEYPVGIERSNATLLLYYAVQGQRHEQMEFEGIGGHSICGEAFRSWPTLVHNYPAFEPPKHTLWNFNLSMFHNPVAEARYFEVSKEHEFLFMKWQTRLPGYEEDKDRYRSETRCGLLEIDGARSEYQNHGKWTYPFFDPHFRWLGPIAEECRAPQGGANYNDSHQVMKAWSARAEGR